MKKLTAYLIVGISLAALSSCGFGNLNSSAPSQPVNPPSQTNKPSQPSNTAAQLYELTMNGVGDKLNSSSIRSLASEVTGLSYALESHGTLADFKTGILHLTANYKVTNNSGAAIALPTFIPVSTAGAYATDAGTPYRNVVNRKGQPMSGKKIELERSHYLNGNLVTENPEATQLIERLDTAALQLQLPANTSTTGISRKGWQGTRLEAGASQIINFAMRVKLEGRDVGDNDPFRFSLVFAVADSPAKLPDNFKAIHEVQGATPSGDAATPLAGQSVTVEGIVTADQRAGDLKGFWVQETGINTDKDINTSEGIFVYCGNSCPAQSAFNVGDLLRISGNAGEFSVTTVTQISNPTISKIVNTVPLPAPQTLAQPIIYSQRERYEGMRISTSGMVTNNYPLGRGSSFDIAKDRIPTFSQAYAPNAAVYAAYKANLKNLFIRIDDFSRKQNPAQIFGRNKQALSANNTLRGGDNVNVTGILHHGNDGWQRGGSLDTYRIHATQLDTEVKPSNSRPLNPPTLTGNLRVGAMNVLNYFNTMRKTAGSCSPFAVSSKARGADNCTEFERQRAKIISAITKLNADVLGLMEIENNFQQGNNSAIANLVSALNDKAGAGTYAYINPQQQVGSDAIAVALIYKPSKVTPIGRLAILGDAYDPKYTESCNRPTIAQSFSEKASEQQFTTAVVHFKSKGSPCAALNDTDQNDGQGNAYKARENAASVLSAWLKTHPTGITDNDYIIVGDFNAYAKEKVFNIFDDADYSNAFNSNSYSYQFDGQWGSLDHALMSASLKQQLADKAKWHINADEPAVLDYNTNYKSSSQISDFYSSDAFRSSDHDPLLVTFNLR